MGQHIKNAGVVLVELLVAFGLASILLPALLTGFVSATQGREVYEQRIAAVGLVREAEEAIRSFRNESWNNVASLTTGINYYPSITTSKWILLSGSESVNGFTRTIIVSDIYRDSNQNIVSSGVPGATLDPSTREFLITVSWPGFINRSISSTLYITRYGNTNLTETQTVIEEAGGFGNWCIPALSTTNVDLNRQGHATVVHALESDNQTGNRVLTGTGANSSGPAFSNIVIQGNSPPSLISNNDYNGTPQIKANGVYGDTDFAYLATDNKGVEILSLGTTPYQQIGSFNPQGMKPANSVYVVGDTGYVATDDKFYIFGISTDRTTTNQIGVMNLSGATRVLVDPAGQYAYVVTPDLTGQIKIIDVHTNPASPTVYGHLAVNGGVGRDIVINEEFTKAYLATAGSANQPEFFIIDITNPAAPTATGATYDTSGMDPQGVAIVTSSRAIIVGTGGNEYQVFSIINDQISPCPNHNQNNDFLNIDAGAFGVSTVFQTDLHAYSYIVTGDANAELKIIEGGPGDGGAGGDGYYESQTLPTPDPGYDVAFNSFSATVDPNLTYKFSIKQGVGGSCSGVTFSDDDFITFAPGTFPLETLGPGFTNPGQCMRYRAINSGVVPITFTININYSP